MSNVPQIPLIVRSDEDDKRYVLMFVTKNRQKLHLFDEIAGAVVSLKSKGRTIIFLSGRVTIFGTCRQFFSKSNVFQTIFFITFCNENNLFTTIFKKRYRLFYRSYLKKALLVHAYTSHLNETNSP